MATHRRAHLSFQLSLLQPPPSFLFWLLVIPLEESASNYLSKSLIQFDMTNNHQHSSLLRLLVNSFLRHHIDTTRYLVLILVYSRRQSTRALDVVWSGGLKIPSRKESFAFWLYILDPQWSLKFQMVVQFLVSIYPW